MQGRSWMAALTIAAGAVLILGLAARADDDALVLNAFKLELRIAGLGRGGCDVEVNPGHAGCQFRPVTQHIDSRGFASLVLSDVQSRSADRDCAFAITIHEPGQEVKTIRRGLRLLPPGPGRPAIQSLTCYLSSPSKLARAAESRERR